VSGGAHGLAGDGIRVRARPSRPVPSLSGAGVGARTRAWTGGPQWTAADPGAAATPDRAGGQRRPQRHPARSAADAIRLTAGHLPGRDARLVAEGRGRHPGRRATVLVAEADHSDLHRAAVELDDQRAAAVAEAGRRELGPGPDHEILDPVVEPVPGIEDVVHVGIAADRYAGRPQHAVERGARTGLAHADERGQRVGQIRALAPRRAVCPFDSPTRIWLALLPYVQWAAVRIQVGAITLPPQTDDPMINRAKNG
jgi:hypothetical protein